MTHALSLDLVITSEPGAPGEVTLSPEAFPYAGKFGRRETGTAIVQEDGVDVGAIAYSPDRTDERCCRIRYVAVRRTRQGEGIAPRLLADFAEAVCDDGYVSVAISTTTPYAFVAAIRGGYHYTGVSGPQGNPILERGADVDPVAPAQGLATFLDPDYPHRYRTYVRERLPSMLDESSRTRDG